MRLSMDCSKRWALALAAAVGLSAGLPQVAAATPVTYFFTGGSVTVSATSGPTTLLSVPNVPLDGNQVTFDDAVPALTDIQIALNAAGPFALTTTYAGFDSVAVSSVLLSPAAGYASSASLQASGPPVDNYAYAGGPVKVTGTISATGPFVTPLVAPFNIVNPAASGTLLVNAVTGNISLLGITIGIVPASGGEPFPLVIKGDFFFRGVVPEPGTALLLGTGLIGLLAAGRRFRA